MRKAATHSDPSIKTALQGDDGYVIDIISHQCPFASCLRLFQKIPASVQFFHPPLLALTTDLPGTADGLLNIVLNRVEGNILAS